MKGIALEFSWYVFVWARRVLSSVWKRFWHLLNNFQNITCSTHTHIQNSHSIHNTILCGQAGSLASFRPKIIIKICLRAWECWNTIAWCSTQIEFAYRSFLFIYFACHTKNPLLFSNAIWVSVFPAFSSKCSVQVFFSCSLSFRL